MKKEIFAALLLKSIIFALYFARSREINHLRWKDIDFTNKTVTLYTRKKKHGTKTPRTIDF